MLSFASFTSLAVLVASASAVTVTNIPSNGKFDYQLGGAYTPASGVKVVSRDRTDSPVNGLYNICYINAFQTQPNEKSFWTGANANLLLKNKKGALFEDPDWPGEYFLDTTTDAKRQALAKIINGWIDQCAAKGFNAIEPDNLDTFTRSSDLLTAANNLALAKLFTDHAHSVGLAVAQKNTGGELEGNGKKTAGFDFAVAEECQFNANPDEDYDECATYTDVYGDKVVEIEYTDNDNGAQVFKDACAARGSKISVILRDRDVVTSTNKKYHYEEC